MCSRKPTEGVLFKRPRREDLSPSSVSSRITALYANPETHGYSRDFWGSERPLGFQLGAPLAGFVN